MSRQNRMREISNRLRGCEGKNGYDTYQHARLVLGETVIKTGDTKLHVYLCTFCNKWHMGHPPKVIK